MEIINGQEIVKFIYDTGCEQISGETRNAAARKFENWINENTPYRGLVMYAKHQGYQLVFEDKDGNRYIHNGLKTYQIGPTGNIIKEVD